MLDDLFILLPIGIIIIALIAIGINFFLERQRAEIIEELNAAQPPLKSVLDYTASGRLLAEALKKPRQEEPTNYTQFVGFLVISGIIAFSFFMVFVADENALSQQLQGLIDTVNTQIQWQLLVYEVPYELYSVIPVVVFVALALLPFILFYLGSWGIFLYRALTWTRTDGVVGTAKLSTFMRGSGRNRRRIYQTRLEVAYRTERGEIYWVNRNIEGWGNASRAMRQYRLGQPVRVWYHPNKPEKALVRESLSPES